MNERCDWDDYYGCFGIDWDSNGYFKGDINIDFQHNVTDIIQQINIILDNHNPTGYEIWAADMNTDISIDILDVVELGNVILGVSRIYRNKLTSTASLVGNELIIFGSIGGIQVSGELLNELIGNDMIVTANGMSVIYNMDGKLETDKFIFSNFYFFQQ